MGSPTDEFKVTLRVSQNRLRRGWILRILNYFQHQKESQGVNDRVIQSGLQQNGHDVTMPTLLADLQYLKEKGYCRVIEQQNTPTFMVVSAAITAQGVDLYEGSIPEDPGIDFGNG